MFFFDVVFEVDKYEFINVVDQVNCEFIMCFDFKGSNVKFELDELVIMVIGVSEFQFKQMCDIFIMCLFICKIDLCVFDIVDLEINVVGLWQKIIVKQGIEQLVVKKLIVVLKVVKFKVEVQINGEKLCVIGKKCDDLQVVIVLLCIFELDVLLQFDNFCD